MKIFRSALQINYEKLNKKEKEGSKRKNRNYLILYVDIKNIFVDSGQINVETKSEIQRFTFETQHLDQIMELLIEMPKKHMGCVFPLIMEPLKTDPLYEPMDTGTFATKKILDTFEKNVLLHVNKGKIIEEEPKTKRILNIKELSSLICVNIKLKKNKIYTLLMQFEHGIFLKYSLKSDAGDYFITELLQERSPIEGTEQPTLLLLLKSSIGHEKIYNFGIDPDFGYETTLSKDIDEAISNTNIFDLRLHQLLINAALNSSYKAVGFDQKILNSLFTLAGEYATIIKKFESDSSFSQICEFFEGNIVEQNLSPRNQSYNVYARLSPLLYVIRSVLVLQASLSDFAIYQKEVELLLSLLKCQNSVIAILASFCLKAMLRVKSYFIFREIKLEKKKLRLQ